MIIVFSIQIRFVLFYFIVLNLCYGVLSITCCSNVYHWIPFKTLFEEQPVPLEDSVCNLFCLSIIDILWACLRSCRNAFSLALNDAFGPRLLFPALGFGAFVEAQAELGLDVRIVLRTLRVLGFFGPDRRRGSNRRCR